MLSIGRRMVFPFMGRMHVRLPELSVLGDVEQMVVTLNALCDSRLAIKLTMHFSLLPSDTLDHNGLQLPASEYKLLGLSSSGSASASRAPRTTCCRSRWASTIPL